MGQWVDNLLGMKHFSQQGYPGARDGGHHWKRPNPGWNALRNASGFYILYRNPTHQCNIPGWRTQLTAQPERWLGERRWWRSHTGHSWILRWKMFFLDPTIEPKTVVSLTITLRNLLKCIKHKCHGLAVTIQQIAKAEWLVQMSLPDIHWIGCKKLAWLKTTNKAVLNGNSNTDHAVLAAALHQTTWNRYSRK